MPGAEHPLDILAFGDSGSGRQPGRPAPFRLPGENGGAATRALDARFLHQQQGYFRAARAETTQFDAQPALFIEFDAPSPLGLINGPNP